MKALTYIAVLLGLSLVAPTEALANHSSPLTYYGGGGGYGNSHSDWYRRYNRPRAMYCTYYGCYFRRRYRQFSLYLGFPGFSLQLNTGWTPQYRYRPFMGGLFGRGLGAGMVGF